MLSTESTAQSRQKKMLITSLEDRQNQNLNFLKSKLDNEDYEAERRDGI